MCTEACDVLVWTCIQGPTFRRQCLSHERMPRQAAAHPPPFEHLRAHALTHRSGRR